VAFLGGATGANYAAVFNGSVVVNGPFVVSDPANKHGAVKLADGTYRLLCSVESPESWLEDFGEAQLVNGKADINLAADFAAIADTGQYHVFLTPYGNANGLHVTGRTATGFTVAEHNGGTNSLPFSWRVVAKPKTDKKAIRLAKFAMPDIKVPDARELPTPPAPKKP
jgi:hypothetical protein